MLCYLRARREKVDAGFSRIKAREIKEAGACRDSIQSRQALAGQSTGDS